MKPVVVLVVDRRKLAAAVRLVAAYDHAPLLVPVPESRQLIIMARDGYGLTVQAEPVQCPADYDGGCATAACGRCLLAALADLDDQAIIEIEEDGPAFVRVPGKIGRRWVPETACHH